MIKQFLNKLTNCYEFDNVENQYSDSFNYCEITRTNLMKYLEIMISLNPDTILIGEAPGYNGCLWSGIPFTSERIIMNEYIRNKLFGINNGFKVRDTSKTQSEASATIVWDNLKDLNALPLLWNAFPFHPHEANNKESNRPPNENELEFGRIVIKELINIYDIKNIISIGNSAYNTLTKMKILSKKVRHPANGGKRKFVSGLNTELGITNS